MWRDLLYATRLIRRAPVFTLTIVAILALGLGVNAAVFSVINALFFRPLPVPAPDQLFYVYLKKQGRAAQAAVEPEFADFLYERSREIADFTSHWRVRMRVSAQRETGPADGEWVETNYFQLLGVRVVLGRSLSEYDPGAANPECEVVISSDLWRRRFGAGEDAIGRLVRLDDVHAVVVGVAEPGFNGVSELWRPSEFWTPGACMDRAALGRGQFDGRRFVAGPIGRLKPGATFQQFQALLATSVPEWKRRRLEMLRERVPAAAIEELRQRELGTEYPVFPASVVRLPYTPEAQLISPVLLVGMIGVGALVLLIAVVNVTGLQLARNTKRATELSVRRALGATRAALVRQLLTENIVIACGAGVLGLSVAMGLLGFLRARLPSLFVFEVPLDLNVLAFTMVICVGGAVVIGFGPVLQARRLNVAQGLGVGVVRASGGHRGFGRWVVMPQVALSFLLLLLGAVQLRAVIKVQNEDRGYETDGRIVLDINRWDPAAAGRRWRPTQEDRQKAEVETDVAFRAFNRSILERVSALPHAVDVALTDGFLLQPGAAAVRQVFARDSQSAASLRVSAVEAVVSDRYFEAMGIHILAGRTFDARDGTYDAPGRPIVVISKRLGHLLWGASNPLSESLGLLPENPGEDIRWVEVVGVVNDVEPLHSGAGAQPRLYRSLLQQKRGYASHVIVRGRADAAELMRSVRRAVLDADPYAEVSRVRTIQQAMDEALFQSRAAMLLLVTSGVVGLLLAGIGVYGVISYSIAQRTREIGIRIALGAKKQEIMLQVLREGARGSVSGTLLGIISGFLVLRSLSARIPGVPQFDLVSFVVVPAVLCLVVCFACLIPARRASRVDPVEVLRDA